MPLFGSRDDPQAPTAGTGPQSDLPAHAMERLRELRGEGGRRPLFTSDLSVNEFLLVRRAGFDPIGLVMGSSIYHSGLLDLPHRLPASELESEPGDDGALAADGSRP